MNAAFTVGSVMGDSWDTFGSVWAVGFDEEANLHILDGQAARILVVGPDGSLVRTVGRQGEGPGEFNRPTELIVAHDGSYHRVGIDADRPLEPRGRIRSTRCDGPDDNGPGQGRFSATRRSLGDHDDIAPR